VLDRVRDYYPTEAYKKAYRKRSVWVEPLFAEGKQWHGMGRFRLRRLWRVNSEAHMIAAGQNLKRRLKRRGWGRRPFPAEAVATAPPPRWEEEELYRGAKRTNHRRKVFVALMVAFGPTRAYFGAQISLFSQIIVVHIILNIFSFIYSMFHFMLFLLVVISRAILCIFNLMLSLVSSARSFSTG
jgi:Transposase DDE domain